MHLWYLVWTQSTSGLTGFADASCLDQHLPESSKSNLSELTVLLASLHELLLGREKDQQDSFSVSTQLAHNTLPSFLILDWLNRPFEKGSR